MSCPCSQAAHGDYTDDAMTRSLVRKTTLLPSYVLKEQPSHTYCEDQVTSCTIHQKTKHYDPYSKHHEIYHQDLQSLITTPQVIEHYKKTAGQTRGQALVNYMTIVESMPTYGVHYFEVYDKRSTPWWLGLSCRSPQ